MPSEVMEKGHKTQFNALWFNVSILSLLTDIDFYVLDFKLAITKVLT